MTASAMTVLVLALASCTAGAEEPIDALKGAESLPVQIAFQGLCESRAIAESSDVQAAADVFQARAHGELHSLADRLSATDRDAAAGLLEAKQRLEAAFADPGAASPPAVAGLVSALEVEVVRAAETLGLQRPVCKGAGA